MTKEERVYLVDWDDPEWSITLQADLLGLNRATLYYKPVAPSPEEIAMKHRIDEIYTHRPFYGSRKITIQLQQEGHSINRKRVQRYMREMGICGITPGPNTSKRRQDHNTFPYLLRNVKASYPNHIWGIDITYIRLSRGWVYLVAVLDWYSRMVISWGLDQTLAIGFVLYTVRHALSLAKPEILNSDQGSHFTSPQYIRLLEEANVQISMDGKGRAIDNVFTERLWRSLKYEEVYLNEYNSPKEARQRIRNYFDFYNRERPHQSLNYRTPHEVYFNDGAGECMGFAHEVFRFGSPKDII